MMTQEMSLLLSHREVEYYTPPKYIEAARQVLGSIDLDPASCDVANKIVRAKTFYTKADDGLTKPWGGRVWLNPPYSKMNNKSNQQLWSDRLVYEYHGGSVIEAVLLVKSALGYVWFENLFERYPVCFCRERISFFNPDGTTSGQAKHGNSFFYFGPNIGKFFDVFSPIGRVILPDNRPRIEQGLLFATEAAR